MLDLMKEAEELAVAGQDAEAASAYENLLSEGAEAQAHILQNLASTLTKSRQLVRAREAAEAQAFFAPGLARSWLTLNHIQSRLGMRDAALASLYRALELEPTNLSVQESRLFALASKLDPQDYRKEAEAWYASLPPVTGAYRRNPSLPGNRVRVGYVSGDFRTHVMDRFIEALLTYPQHSQFDVHCFDDSPAGDDNAGRRRLKAIPGITWIDIRGLTPAQVTSILRLQKMDILVDLAGLSAHHSFHALRQRCAPLQLTGIGFLPTTGGDCFDFRIADYEDPREYTEPLWKLPRAAVPMPLHPEIEVSPLPAERNGFVTFGYVNGLHKLTPDSIQQFVRVLRLVPSSKLLVMLPGASDGRTAAEVLRRFDPVQDRVMFTESQGGAAFCNLFKDIDIALDPTPYGGCTTTVDSLFHGVPVLTGRPDRRLNADAWRLQMEFELQQQGLTGAAIDIRQPEILAGDLNTLAFIRRALRPAYLDHHVGDPRGWVGLLEQSYIMMLEKVKLQAAA